MQKTYLFYKSSVTCLVIGLLSACSSVTHVPAPSVGTENIKISIFSAPTTCQFLGNVQSEQENGRTQSYTSHANLQADELKDLQNQTLALYGNLLVVTEHKTTYGNHTVAKESFHGGAKVKIVDWHYMAGEAYKCSSAVLNSVAPATQEQLSDLHHHDD